MKKPKKKSTPQTTTRGVRPYDKQVGARIRLARLDRNMSQEKLGEMLMVSFQQVQKYEKGANRVTIGRLQEIAKALNVPVNALMDDPSHPVALVDHELFKIDRRIAMIPDAYRAPLLRYISALVEIHEVEKKK